MGHSALPRLRQPMMTPLPYPRLRRPACRRHLASDFQEITNIIMSPFLPAPVTVHIPADEHHGHILTLCFDEERHRSPFADPGTPTGVRIEQVTSAGRCDIDGYALAFAGRTLADAKPDSESAAPRPEIYALLIANNYLLPESAMIASGASAILSGKNTFRGRPLLPTQHEIERLRGIIVEQSEAMRLTPEKLQTMIANGDTKVLVARQWSVERPIRPDLLGREAHVAHVDYTNRMVKVVPDQRHPDVSVVLPMDALSLRFEQTDYQRRYDPANPQFARGERVRVVADEPAVGGRTGTVCGYATRPQDAMPGVSAENPAFAVHYDGKPSYAWDMFFASELEALRESASEQPLPEIVSSDAPLVR
jgi:hypothetical protein